MIAMKTPQIDLFPAKDGAIRLIATQEIPGKLEDIFAFFSNPANLRLLTPPEVSFEFLSDPNASMCSGLKLDYKIKINGFPMRWTSEIVDWEPPYHFSDIQLKGPYRQWDHHHRFEESALGVLITDDVTYRTPGPAWLEQRFIRKKIVRIFEYRQAELMRQMVFPESDKKTTPVFESAKTA